MTKNPTTYSKISDLLSDMWTDYCLLNPEARRIYDFFTSQGEKVLNDHIALRTFNLPNIGISALAKVFIKHGFKPAGEYHFPEKKLYAIHFQHPDSSLPKIFISELKLEEMSDFVRTTLTKCAAQIPLDILASDSLSMAGRPWKMSHATYLELAKESEYASWVAAYGFRPNHFTININALQKFQDINHLNEIVEKQGFKFNRSGGLVKGSPEVCLEQSSTMAAPINVKFDDGEFPIPGCYYEFAKRYPMKNGELYQGFVSASADKIFESTNRT